MKPCQSHAMNPFQQSHAFAYKKKKPLVAIFLILIFSLQQNGFDPKFLRRKEEQRRRSLDIWGTLMGLGSPIMGSEQDQEGPAAMADVRIDWKETPEAHIIQVDLPGLRKEEVKVEFEDGRVLQVSGERRREQEDKTDKWHCVERSIGKFVRRFRLPENVRLDDVRANMEYGLLNIVVPKAEDKKPKVKAINIGGEEGRGPSDISA